MIQLQEQASQGLQVSILQIEGPDGTFFDVVNRTNNGLERYNRHFNGLFNKSKRPSLLEFVKSFGSTKVF